MTMLKHLAASKDNGEYFQYYLQGDNLYLDHTEHLLLRDVLDVSVGSSVISIQT